MSLCARVSSRRAATSISEQLLYHYPWCRTRRTSHVCAHRTLQRVLATFPLYTLLLFAFFHMYCPVPNDTFTLDLLQRYWPANWCWARPASDTPTRPYFEAVKIPSDTNIDLTNFWLCCVSTKKPDTFWYCRSSLTWIRPMLNNCCKIGPNWKNRHNVINVSTVSKLLR